MRKAKTALYPCVAAFLVSFSSFVLSALPPPTPEQAQAAAAKKAQADAQAEKEKRELAASMEKISDYWRAKAVTNGWQTHPPTPVASPVKALDAPAKQSGPSGQPDGRMGSAAQDAPKHSEKAGTAPPSEDVKKAPAEKQ